MAEVVEHLDNQQQVELLASVNGSETKALWVFGYGSLCWKPGFRFDKAVVGHVRGFSRKFWQGNATHRGTKEQPGRVATLIDDDTSSVYGVAFSVSGENALPYLTNRECTLGGYDTRFATFHPIAGEPLKVLLYIATPKNHLWLGDAPASEIARQIFASSGDSGHNVEYLVRLANFMRHHFPDASDSHLFNIEEHILHLAKIKQVDVAPLMGSGEGCITYAKPNGFSRQAPAPAARGRDREEREENRDTFQFTARVPEKSLRCLNI